MATIPRLDQASLSTFDNARLAEADQDIQQSIAAYIQAAARMVGAVNRAEGQGLVSLLPGTANEALHNQPNASSLAEITKARLFVIDVRDMIFGAATAITQVKADQVEVIKRFRGTR